MRNQQEGSSSLWIQTLSEKVFLILKSYFSFLPFRSYGWIHTMWGFLVFKLVISPHLGHNYHQHHQPKREILVKKSFKPTTPMIFHRFSHGFPSLFKGPTGHGSHHGSSTPGTVQLPQELQGLQPAAALLAGADAGGEGDDVGRGLGCHGA